MCLESVHLSDMHGELMLCHAVFVTQGANEA